MKMFRRILKLLRHLSVLDWLVAVIIVGALIFLLSLTLNRSKWITVEFKVTLTPQYFPYTGENPPYWITEKIRPGDVQYDSLGQKNLQVLSVTSWGYNNLQTWVKASVKAKYNPAQKLYSFQYQPLEIGRPIDVSINGTGIHGIVTAVQGFSDTRPTYTVTVKARLIDTSSPYSMVTQGVEPWIADAIDTGLIMKDVSGNTVAEVLDKDVRLAERVITTSDGRITTGDDPIRKDVYLTIKLTRVTKVNNTYLFMEDNPVVIGTSFPFFSKQIIIYPVITQILD